MEGALKAAGGRQPLSILDLLFRGVPFELPRADEPSLGYLEPGEVVQAYKVYDGISIMGMLPEIRDTVQDLGGWLKGAMQRQHALVGVLQ